MPTLSIFNHFHRCLIKFLHLIVVSKLNPFGFFQLLFKVNHFYIFVIKSQSLNPGKFKIKVRNVKGNTKHINTNVT
eukprot:UN15369